MPVELVEITIPDPGPNDVADPGMRVGHTDLTYRCGGINDDFPFLLRQPASWSRPGPRSPLSKSATSSC